MKTTVEKIAVMQAHEDGFKIKAIPRSGGELGTIVLSPTWNWLDFDYDVIEPPTGSDIVRELLKGGKPVLCGISNESQEHADNGLDAGYYRLVSGFNQGMFESQFCFYCYASPVDTSKFTGYVPEGKE